MDYLIKPTRWVDGLPVWDLPNGTPLTPWRATGRRKQRPPHVERLFFSREVVNFEGRAETRGAWVPEDAHEMIAQMLGGCNPAAGEVD